MVARLLGVERFGVLHLVMSTVGLITALLTVRVWETIIRFLTEFEAQDEAERALAIVKLAYGLDIVLGVLVFAFVAVIAPLLGALVVQTSDATDLIRLEGLRHLLLVTSGASTLSCASSTASAGYLHSTPSRQLESLPLLLLPYF